MASRSKGARNENPSILDWLNHQIINYKPISEEETSSEWSESEIDSSEYSDTSSDSLTLFPGSMEDLIDDSSDDTHST